MTYNKEWYQNNKESQALAGKSWRLKNPGYGKKWHQENKEDHALNCKTWAAKNPEKILAAQKKWRVSHREEINAKARQWVKDNPEKQLEKSKRQRQRPEYKALRRNALLKKVYGITIEQFAEMAETQGYKCAACNTDKPGGTGSWHVDHCHKSDVVRGLLCWRCNVMLGQAGDEESVLQGLIDYLRKHKDE